MPASNIAEYLASLPEDRRAAISAVRKEINARLPKGYEEGMQFGAISWFVPLAEYPAGYGGNKKVPLPLLTVANQKAYVSISMLCFYGNDALSDWFTSEYKKTGKKLDMGLGCVRFKELEGFPLDVLGRTVARIPVKQHVANYQAAREAMKTGKKKSAPAKKTAAKKAPAKKKAKPKA